MNFLKSKLYHKLILIIYKTQFRLRYSTIIYLKHENDTQSITKKSSYLFNLNCRSYGQAVLENSLMRS